MRRLFLFSSILFFFGILTQPIAVNADEVSVNDFFQAIGNGDVDEVRRVLAKNAEMVKVTSPDGETPLHVSAIRGVPQVGCMVIVC